MNQEVNQQLIYDQTHNPSKIETNIVKQDLQDLFQQTRDQLVDKSSENEEHHEQDQQLNTKLSQIQQQLQQELLQQSQNVTDKSLPQSQKSLFQQESDIQGNNEQEQDKSQPQSQYFGQQVESLKNLQKYEQEVEINQEKQQEIQQIKKKHRNNLANSILQLEQIKYDESEEQKIIRLVDEKYELKKNSNKQFQLCSQKSHQSDEQSLNDEVKNFDQLKQKFNQMKQFVQNSQEQKAKQEQEFEKKLYEQNTQKIQEIEKFYEDKIDDLKNELQQLLYKQQMDLKQQNVPDIDQYNEYIKVKSNEYDDMIKILQNQSDNSKQTIIIQQNQRIKEQNLLRAVYEKQFQNYQEQFKHLYDMTKKFVQENANLHTTIQDQEKQQQETLKQIQELKFIIEKSIDQLQQKEYQLKSKSIELEDLIEKCQFENQMLKEIKSQANVQSNIQTDNMIEYYNHNGVNKTLNQKELRQQNQYENDRIVTLEQQLQKAAAIIRFFKIELENYKNVYNMFGPQNKSMNVSLDKTSLAKSKLVSDQFNKINVLKNQISKRQVQFKDSNKNKRKSQINIVNQKFIDIHDDKIPFPKQGLPQINDHHQQNKNITLERKFRNRSTDVVNVFPNNLMNQSMALIQSLYGENDKQDKYKKISQKINNSLILM